MNHQLVDGTLYKEHHGIIGRCACGWSTGYHFSSMAASAHFQEHLEHVSGPREYPKGNRHG